MTEQPVQPELPPMITRDPKDDPLVTEPGPEPDHKKR